MDNLLARIFRKMFPLLLLLASTAHAVTDANWVSMASSLGNVNAVAFDTASGNLYIGGTFTSVNGVPANRIARWDGSAWSALAGGMNGAVKALALDANGNLYAGGDFLTADGVTATRIARWDGNNWSALGNGVSSTVNALLVHPTGDLYAAGAFGTAGAVSARRVAKWNGTDWSALGSGLSGCQVTLCSVTTALSLAVDNSGNVYVGGDFKTAGGVSAMSIARWDGAGWNALGQGVSGCPLASCTSIYVAAMAFDGLGNLYVGGRFSNAGPNGGLINVARWDGSHWYGLGLGTNDAGSVAALQVDASNRVYVGGSFTSVNGGMAASRMASWNGSSWSALASGTNNTVNALTRDPAGRLYVGGAFSAAGGQASANIAQWLPDSDNDGTPDINDAFPLDPTETVDTDSDGTGNNADTDDDGDGTPDVIDIDPINPAVSENNLPLDGGYKGSSIKDAANIQ